MGVYIFRICDDLKEYVMYSKYLNNKIPKRWIGHQVRTIDDFSGSIEDLTSFEGYNELEPNGSWVEDEGRLVYAVRGLKEYITGKIGLLHVQKEKR